MEFRLGHHLQQAREQRRVAAGFPPSVYAIEEPPAAGLVPVPDEHAEPEALTQIADLAVDAPEAASIITSTPPPPGLFEAGANALFMTPKRRFADRTTTPLRRKPSEGPALPSHLPSGLPSRAAANAADLANAPDLADAADLADTIEPAAEPVPSRAPTLDRCLNCQGTVRVDMFDLVAGCAYLTCVDCGFTYTAKSPSSV